MPWLPSGYGKRKSTSDMGTEAEHKIGLLIEIADIPRSTYYYYSKQFDHPKPDRYAEIKTEIRRIYDESKGRYGYRRITKELKKKFVVNHKTV